MLEDKELEKEEDIEFLENEEICPVCKSSTLIKEGRCTTCIECGWSKCSI